MKQIESLAEMAELTHIAEAVVAMYFKSLDTKIPQESEFNRYLAVAAEDNEKSLDALEKVARQVYQARLQQWHAS